MGRRDELEPAAKPRSGDSRGVGAAADPTPAERRLAGALVSPAGADRARLPIGEAPDERETVETQRDPHGVAPVQDAGMAPALGAKIGRFLILEELGAGASGVVLAAYDPQLDRRVALKLLHGGQPSAPDDRERILREARALARVVHPNTVAVHDAGYHGDALLVVMELVHGTTLRRWLDERPRSLDEIVAVFVQAGTGLAAAHAAGVVHRDFKPDNVLVGTDGRVRVGDFGLAHVLDDERGVAAPAGGAGVLVTRSGMAVGTPAYMAPEQHEGRPVDERADQFAFCVTLHEALHGERPFEGATAGEIAEQIRTGRVRKSPRRVSARLRAVLARGLATEPAARFPSMAALVDALRAHGRRRDLGSGRTQDRHYPEHLLAPAIDGLPGTRSGLGRPRGALPAQPTRFIGRSRLIAEVAATLRGGDARLVTLTGPGGTGKTRLSIEVAQALEADFPGAVVQVRLGSVHDPALVLPTIARTLDLPEVPGTPPLKVLANAIGATSLLLVLDNFEQVVDAAPAVAELLEACSGLKVLVTTRELLRVRGERERGVPPLELPSGGAADDFEAIAASEAVRLFIERARDLSAGFALTPENAPIVAAICARLEAIPLAIELAASRLKTLSLEALHERLSDRLGFLKAMERDREQRHRTLRAAIDWSHDLLDEPQQVLFRRASVFVGGFSLESAEVVCGEGREVDVLEGISSLVGKSLLTISEVDGAPRFGALETLREYAQERLRASPDEPLVRARHAERFAAFVEARADGVLSRDWRLHVGPLLSEMDNIRAALDWALAQPTPHLTVRLLRALQWFWMTHGRIAEGRAFADRALAQTERLGPSEPRGVVLEVAGWLDMLSGDVPAASAHSNEGLALWRALDREADGARTQILHGFVTAVMGDFPAGRGIVQGACTMSRTRGDRIGVALALNVLAELARGAGDHELALARNEELLGILHDMGNVILASLVAINLAHGHLHRGDWAKAAEVVIQTLELSQELNNPFNLAYYFAVMASVAVVRGQHAEGLRLFGAFDTTLRSIGATAQPTDQETIQHYLDAATVALGEEAAAAARQEGAQWTRAQAIAATIPLRT